MSRTISAFALLSVFVLASCSGESQTAAGGIEQSDSNQSTSKLDDHAVEWAREYATGQDRNRYNHRTKADCDPVEATSIVDREYGTITHVDDLRFSAPIPAMRAIVEIRCVNRAKAQKYSYYVQTFFGLDEEFSMWRCNDIQSANEYGPDGNTIVGYKEQPPFGTSSKSFAAMCGFSAQG